LLLPFFFRFFSLFLSLCLPSFSSFLEVGGARTQRHKRHPAEKKKKEKKSIATAVVLRTHGPNHPVLVFSLSFSQSLSENLFFAFAVKSSIPYSE
jgi:hypothetical protein